MDAKTDEELAHLVQEGNHEAFGKLVERYENKLMRYAGRFLFKGDEAKDLLQEIFIKTYVNIKSFDSSRRFSPWIYRIAHNEFINAISRREKTKETFSIFDFDILLPQPLAKENAESEFEKSQLKDMLDKNLEKLDSKYREPLILFYFEEMDYASIADILKIPISTVGVRLRRGREILKKLVQKEI